MKEHQKGELRTEFYTGFQGAGLTFGCDESPRLTSMVKIKRIRTKHCCRCTSSKDTLFRIRVEKDGDWIFLCRDCLETVKPGNPHYQYGGTWKSKKRH